MYALYAWCSCCAWYCEPGLQKWPWTVDGPTSITPAGKLGSTVQFWSSTNFWHFWYLENWHSSIKHILIEVALPVGPRMVGFHQDGLEIPARPISEAVPAESWHQRLISSWETNHHHLSSANITITITITSHHHPSPSPIITKHQHPSSTIITSHQPMTPPSVSTQSQTELSTSKRRPTSSTKTNSVFYWLVNGHV